MDKIRRIAKMIDHSILHPTFDDEKLITAGGVKELNYFIEIGLDVLKPIQAPAHNIQDYTPVENILAFFKAAKEL